MTTLTKNWREQVAMRGDIYTPIEISRMRALPEFVRLVDPMKQDDWDSLVEKLSGGCYPKALPCLVATTVGDDVILIDGRTRRLACMTAGISVAPVFLVKLDSSNLFVGVFELMVHFHKGRCPIEVALWMSKVVLFMDRPRFAIQCDSFDFQQATTFVESHSITDLKLWANTLSHDEQLCLIMAEPKEF